MKLYDDMEKLFTPMVNAATGMIVELPEDPVSFGLTSFHGRIAQIRAFSNQVATWQQHAIVAKREAQARKTRARLVREERYLALLAADPTVREAQGGQGGREAAAKSRLTRENRIVEYADMLYTQALGFYEALNRAQENLKETKRDAMSQLAVIRDQIRMGEVDSSTFPVDRTGVSIPTTKNAEIETELQREMSADGTINF
jgi:hypothetical protein